MHFPTNPGNNDAAGAVLLCNLHTIGNSDSGIVASLYKKQPLEFCTASNRARAVVSGSNGQDGVFITGHSSQVAIGSLVAGVAATDGVTETPNVGAGLSIELAGKDASVTVGVAPTTRSEPTVLIGGNGGSGIALKKRVAAKEPSVAGGVATVLGAFIGVGSDGISPVGNHDGGITVSSGAFNRVVVGPLESAAKGKTVVSNNTGHGTASESTSFAVRNVVVGLSSNSLVNLGNGGDGVHVSPNVADASVTKCTIGSNGGSGIQSAAKSTTVQGNHIGPDASVTSAQVAQDFGNRLYGLYLKPTVTAGSGSKVSGNTFGANKRSAIRNDAVGITATGTVELQGPLADGWGLDACSYLCRCSTIAPDKFGIGTPATEAGSEVDCRGTATNLGIDFPTELPLNTAILRLSGAGLTAVPWEKLYTFVLLEVLDLSDNPELNALPPATGRHRRRKLRSTAAIFRRDNFPSLKQIDLQGTDMSKLERDTFADLAGAQPEIESLDPSRPSKTPDSSVVVDLTGFHGLGAMLWYNLDCPPGYYDAGGLCARCPIGTEKLTPGGAGAACTPCRVGTIDHDEDPVTECKPASFAIKLNPDRRGPEYIDPVTKDTVVVEIRRTGSTIFAIRQAYTLFPPPRLLEQGTTPSVGDFKDITFTLLGAPDGFFVQPATGKAFGQFGDEARGRNYTVILAAVDKAGVQVEVERLELSDQYRDTDVIDGRSNGPHKRGCLNGAAKVDEVPFDGEFTCKCTALFSGDNCETLETLADCNLGEIKSEGLCIKCAPGSTASESQQACVLSPPCPSLCECTSDASASWVDIRCARIGATQVLPIATRNMWLAAPEPSVLWSATLSRISGSVVIPASDIDWLPSSVLNINPDNGSTTDALGKFDVSAPSLQAACTVNPLLAAGAGIGSPDLRLVICPPQADGAAFGPECDSASMNLLCPAGTLASLTGGCTPCSAGGFYSDREGAAGEQSHCGCSTCPVGTFSAEPGAGELGNCSVCPTGTRTDELAGYRACRCLDGFSRVDRFGPCQSCEGQGIRCAGDAREPLDGHFWSFETDALLAAYIDFTNNLQRTFDRDPAFDRFDGELPPVYKCPTAGHCLGGISSSCKSGTTGPLCAVCDDAYFRLNGG